MRIIFRLLGLEQIQNDIQHLRNFIMADLEQLKSALAANTAAAVALNEVVIAESAQANAKLTDLVAQIKTLMDKQAGITAVEADALLASIEAATVNLKTVSDAVSKIIPDAPIPSIAP